MARSKSTQNGEQVLESTVLTGAEAIKDGFEKAVKSYDQFVAFGKDNAEAMLKSANAAGKGMETLNSEVFAFTRKLIEDGVAATKAVLSAKTVEEAFQLQGEYSKAVFQTQVDEAAKLGELALSAARETAEPLHARLNAVADFVRAG
jgi:phasin family protein